MGSSQGEMTNAVLLGETTKAMARAIFTDCTTAELAGGNRDGLVQIHHRLYVSPGVRHKGKSRHGGLAEVALVC